MKLKFVNDISYTYYLYTYRNGNVQHIQNTVGFDSMRYVESITMLSLFRILWVN